MNESYPVRRVGSLARVTLCAAAFVVSYCATAVAVPPAAPLDLSSVLEAERERNNLPGVAAIVIRGDLIIARGAVGLRKMGDETPVASDDRWHLGSCTKAMTATMIAKLIENGELSWDTTIAGALPDLAKTMRSEYRDVTVEMLLAHRGRILHEWDVEGLWAKLWKREGTPREQRRRMATAMLAEEPKVAPGEFFYANCGYGIAGHMAEVITGKPWEDLMRELIFEPLEMTSAGFGVPGSADAVVAPWPHRADGEPIPPGPFADNPPSIGPGGTVHASIDDWAKFVAEHLKGSRGKNGKLLKARTYQRLHRGQATGNSEAYALGWKVLTRPWARGDGKRGSGRCLHHSGSNNSWFCLVWVMPQRNIAIMCTTNIGGKGVFRRLDAVVGAVIKTVLTR